MKVSIVVNVLFFYFGYVSEVNIVEYFYFLDYFVLVDLIFVDIEDYMLFGVYIEIFLFLVNKIYFIWKEFELCYKIVRYRMYVEREKEDFKKY